MTHPRMYAVGLFILVCISFIPHAALAQQTSAIAGVVRDTSGAVLPGVTVEAASPVLIEKVRTVVTDDQGRYNIVDLRPGVYRVTFTLAGFNTLVRDGVTLTSGFTAAINVDLPVGALPWKRARFCGVGAGLAQCGPVTGINGGMELG